MNLHDLMFYLHLGSLTLAACGMVYADHLAFTWWRGHQTVLLTKYLHQAHYVVSFALASLIVSGIYLFLPMSAYLLHQPLFYVKMGFIWALIVNSFAIGRLMHLATHTPFQSLARGQKASLMVSGVISVTCWAGAGMTALLLFHF